MAQSQITGMGIAQLMEYAAKLESRINKINERESKYIPLRRKLTNEWIQRQKDENFEEWREKKNEANRRYRANKKAAELAKAIIA